MNIILSISVVVFLHYAWYYFKDNYSTKKKKDLVECQSEKYKQIIQEIQKQKEDNLPKNTFISPEEKQTMIDELRALLIEGEEPISYEIRPHPPPTTTPLLMPPAPKQVISAIENIQNMEQNDIKPNNDETIHISLQNT